MISVNQWEYEEIIDFTVNNLSDLFCLLAGRGFPVRLSRLRWRPLLLWWPTESWLRSGLPSAAAQLLTISCQHLRFSRSVIRSFQWQLSPFGGCGSRKRRGHAGWGGSMCWWGVYGTWICRREWVNRACWPWDAPDEARIWGQPAGGWPGDRERQRGECVQPH